MEPVQFNCPLCTGLFQVDPAMAGGEVLCPNCQGTVTIPAFNAPPPVEPPASAAMELSCPLCTGVFQVTPDMAGLQVSCPHCTGVVMIPAESGPPSVAAPPVSETPPVPFTSPPTEPPVEAAASAMPKPVEPKYPPQSPAAAPDATAPRASYPTTGDSSPVRNFYPPGFEPKRVEPPTETKQEKPAAAAASDYRYPPSQVPKIASQPQTVVEQPTSKDSTKASTSPIHQEKRHLDSMLPPGAPGLTPPPPETPRQVDESIDAMLPPGASASTSASTTKRSKADALLPPGADSTEEDSPIQQRPLPASEKNRPIKMSKDIVITTEDGGVATLHEPERTIVGEGGSKVRLRTLSAEEKSRKRSLKSLAMWVICVVVLIGVLIILVNK